MIEQQTVSFMVPGKVVPWARAGKNGKRHFTRPEQAFYMSLVGMVAREAMRGREIFTTPVSITIYAYFEWPKATSKKRMETTEWKGTKPDSDNIAKIVGDSLNGIVFKDDALIAYSQESKLWTKKSGLWVGVRSLDGDPPIQMHSGALRLSDVS